MWVGAVGYTLQPSGLTPVTDQDTDFDTKCAVYIFSQSTVVPVLFLPLFFAPISTFLLGIHTRIMIASPHTRLSCGHEIGTTAGLSGGVSFSKRKQENNWLWKVSEDPPDTSLPPLLLCYELLNPRRLTLWFIKDLLGESAVTPLTFKSCEVWQSGIWGARSWQTTSLALPVDNVGGLSTEKMQYHL